MIRIHKRGALMKYLRVLAFAALAAGLAQTGCVVPRLIWPQDDILGSELNAPASEKRVLVASRSSEFKDAVVERLRQGLRDDAAYVKFVGLDDLEQEDGAKYDAVVLINTCIAWGFDPKVDGFLKRQKQQEHIVVLTTSGNGTWTPKAEGRAFDAVATASEKADIDKVADRILEKVQAILLQD